MSWVDGNYSGHHKRGAPISFTAPMKSWPTLRYSFGAAAGGGGEGQPRPPPHLLEVPEEVRLLHPHEGHACCRADDEDGASGAGAVGDELPELRVHGHLQRPAGRTEAEAGDGQQADRQAGRGQTGGQAHRRTGRMPEMQDR